MRPKGSQVRQTMNKVEKMDVDEPILVDSDARNGGHQDINPVDNNNRKKKNRRNKKSAKTAAAAAYPNIDVIDLTTDEDAKADSLLADDPVALEIELDEEADMPELIDVEPIPADVLAESWKQKGNAHFALGEYHHALEMYTKAIEIFANEAAYYGNRSACYLMLKKYKEALVDARAAVQIDSNFEKGHLRLLRATLSLGDVAACEAAVKAINDNSSFTMHIQPETSKLTTLKQNLKDITIARARKDYRKVLYLCERTMDIANGNMQLKMWKADALSMLERYSEAQDVCTDALQSDSKSVEAIYMYSVCLYQADNLEKAVQFLRQSLQLAPDNTECLSLYRKLKQLKELREQASTMFSSSQYVEARLNYSQCLEVMKNIGLKNNTIESKLHFNLSLIAHKKGDVDSSLESCKIAIDKNPNYLKAILHQAKLHSAKEMFEESVRDYEAALKIDPKLKDVRRYLQEAKLSAKKAKRKDYYKILNIDKQASEDEIRKAYKKRALVHHPDRHASATETVRKENERLFKEVGEAYEVLSDPKKKIRYDQGHDLIDSPSADSYDSFDPNTLFNVFFSQGGMGMGGGGGGGPPRGGFHHFRTGPSYSGFNR